MQATACSLLTLNRETVTVAWLVDFCMAFLVEMRQRLSKDYCTEAVLRSNSLTSKSLWNGVEENQLLTTGSRSHGLPFQLYGC